MAIQEDQVREALKQVIDPELFVNIVDLGLIYAVDIQDGEGDKKNIKIDNIGKYQLKDKKIPESLQKGQYSTTFFSGGEKSIELITIKEKL